MRRRWVHLILVLGLAGCGGNLPSTGKASPTPSPSPTPQVATGPGVSLQVPQPNWLVDTTVTFSGAKFSPGEQAVLGLVDEGSSANQIGVIRDSVSEINSEAGHPVTLDELGHAGPSWFAQSNQCPAPSVVPQHRQVAGTDAEFGDVDCGQFKARVLVTIHQGYAYLAILVSKVTAFDASAAAFETAVNSWKWV